MIEWIKQSFDENWKLAASVTSSVVVAVVIAGLVIYCHSVLATLGALFGTLLGWASGILLAPYENEERRFAKISKAAFGFVAGFGAGKFDRILDLIGGAPSSGAMKEPLNVDVLLGACCSLLATITVFVSRTYSLDFENDEKGDDREEK